jgi:hypothetical protein
MSCGASQRGPPRTKLPLIIPSAVDHPSGSGPGLAGQAGAHQRTNECPWPCLRSYARQVAAYSAWTRGGAIIGFAHEPKGDWYCWGYRHAAPAAFVAAGRHIVTMFRQQGAENVTWLWTVNIVDLKGGIPSPAAWWPGASYVTWVGIDRYYLKPSWKFAPLFGPRSRPSGH